MGPKRDGPGKGVDLQGPAASALARGFKVGLARRCHEAANATDTLGVCRPADLTTERACCRCGGEGDAVIGLAVPPAHCVSAPVASYVLSSTDFVRLDSRDRSRTAPASSIGTRLTRAWKGVQRLRVSQTGKIVTGHARCGAACG